MLKTCKNTAPLCFFFALLSCGSDPIGELPCSSLLAGDLVITEVMSNPMGQDGGNEYIEIYNASSRTLSLASLKLSIVQDDIPSTRSYTFGETELIAEEYLTLGDTTIADQPEHIDIAYDSALGSLLNSGGQLGLFCGSTSIDIATYPQSGDGQASVLDGAVPPDAANNDDATGFCDSENAFSADIFGSPGSANQSCGGSTSSGCVDPSGPTRAPVVPALGELIITEIMPNPGTVSDNDGEWFELTSTTPFDLNALQIGTSGDDLNALDVGDECVFVEANEPVVLARNANTTVNGGLVGIEATFDLRLTNENGVLFVGANDSVLDGVNWLNADQGVSISLSSDQYDNESNDLAENFCDGIDMYGDGDLGSPGNINPLCGDTTMDPPDDGGNMDPPAGDTCLDGGAPRTLRAPGVGDVSIVEVMPNPSQVSDTNGEYIEVLVNTPIDLNGLQVGRSIVPAPTPEFTFESDDCLAFEPGDRFLLVRNPDPLANGGLPVENVFDANIALTQTAGTTITLYLGMDQTIFNSFQYNGSDVVDGSSLSLDENGMLCPSTDIYGDGDNGTPGLPNPLCP